MVHISSYLADTAARMGDGVLWTCEGRETTASEAARRVAALSVALARRLGLQAGDRVCTAAQCSERHLEALLAACSAGCLAAPLNTRWAAGEAAAAAALVAPRAVVADAAGLALARAAAAGAAGGDAGVAVPLVLLGNPASFPAEALRGAAPIYFAEDLMCGGRAAAALPLVHAPGGGALIVFTSGTTGGAKGVVLGHAALHAQSQAKIAMCGYCPADIYLHAAPLFHVGGLSSALGMLLAGARHAFLPRFDPGQMLDMITAQRVTAFIAVPAMAAELLASASAAGVATLPSVRRVLVGGGSMPPGLLAGLSALLPGAALQSAYGLTEGASSLTFLMLRPPGGGPGGGREQGAQRGAGVPPGAACVGSPPPGIELAVLLGPGGCPGPRAEGPGGPCTPGRVASEGHGEVLTRGPHTMLGYWRDADATAAARLPGGWLRTGDAGSLRAGTPRRPPAPPPACCAAPQAGDMPAAAGTAASRGQPLAGTLWLLGQAKGTTASSGPPPRTRARLRETTTMGPLVTAGTLWLLGRAKDTIKTGGENVHASQVEAALCLHPGVAAAAAVGVADWRLGEAVAAGVELRAGWSWRGPRCQALLPQRAAGSVGPVGPAAAADGGGGGGGAVQEVGGAALQAHCRTAAGLAGFKLPRVLWCGALPRNSGGKVVKEQLRRAIEEDVLQMGAAAAGQVAQPRL